MNWKSLVLNLLGMFAAGYGTAAGAGQPPKVAVGAGVVAAVSGVSGLFQKQPHA